jgi:hypothetical protein
MDTVNLGAAIVATLIYFFRLEADYLWRIDLQRFKEEQEVTVQHSVPVYDFIVGKILSFLIYK